MTWGVFIQAGFSHVCLTAVQAGYILSDMTWNDVTVAAEHGAVRPG